jgi:hypothetical protein
MIRKNEEIILKALETGYFFRGEYIKVFWGKGHQERFDFRPHNRSAEHEFEKLSKVNQWRFIVSRYQWNNKGEPEIYDYEPTEIIPLTKEMKLALLKRIATGQLSKEDGRLLIIGIGIAFLNMLSEEEMKAREQAREE